MEIRRIGVIGPGMMGSGIAQLAAMNGFEVNLNGMDEATLKQGLDAIGKFMRVGVERGKYTADDLTGVFSRITTFTSIEEAVRDCDFVIESVFELADLKRDIFRSLEKYAPPHAVLATNTSSISIAEIASVMSDPGRVVGMHFNSPVPVSRIVEIISSVYTTAECRDAAVGLAGMLGKEHIRAKDFPGFVPSRIGTVLVNQAFYLLQDGVATPEDIDKAAKLTFNHKMGPLELGDYIGLDTILRVMEYLHAELGEMYRPSPLLKNYVKAGLLGRKTGRGVFDYRGEKSMY